MQAFEEDTTRGIISACRCRGKMLSFYTCTVAG